MKYFAPLAALVATIALLGAPAQARSSFVLDGAGMFGAATVSALNSRLTNFNAQTGKEVLVETVPSLNGAALTDAAQREFAQQQVNGILIFIAKDDRRDIIVPDRAGVQAGWFDSETLRSIRQSMEAQFKDGDFDGGITTAVSGVLGIYRSHMSSLRSGSGATVPATRTSNSSASGFHLNGFWLIVILIGAFLVLRSLMRAMSAPRMYARGPVPPGAPGAPPGPGYGPGNYGGGGSGFWSGLLGGLGGAWLGNEMFRGGGSGGGPSAGSWGGSDAGAAGGAAPDAGGWSSYAGQADAGGASGGDWSGGGFGGGDSGGGGDFGGGGGGGGDSGGGW
jgi:uncharacterized protein